MKINKICEADLQNKGVVGLRDIPALSTAEMQEKFEEIVRSIVIPKVNEIIENVFTKTETNSAIDAKVVEIGSGDMAKGVYDTNDNGKVDTAENAERLGGISAQTILSRIDALENRQNISLWIDGDTLHIDKL